MIKPIRRNLNSYNSYYPLHCSLSEQPITNRFSLIKHCKDQEEDILSLDNLKAKGTNYPTFAKSTSSMPITFSLPFLKSTTNVFIKQYKAPISNKESNKPQNSLDSLLPLKLIKKGEKRDKRIKKGIDVGIGTQYFEFIKDISKTHSNFNNKEISTYRYHKDFDWGKNKRHPLLCVKFKKIVQKYPSVEWVENKPSINKRNKINANTLFRNNEIVDAFMNNKTNTLLLHLQRGNFG